MTCVYQVVCKIICQSVDMQGVRTLLEFLRKGLFYSHKPNKISFSLSVRRTEKFIQKTKVEQKSVIK